MHVLVFHNSLCYSLWKWHFLFIYLQILCVMNLNIFPIKGIYFKIFFKVCLLKMYIWWWWWCGQAPTMVNLWRSENNDSFVDSVLSFRLFMAPRAWIQAVRLPYQMPLPAEPSNLPSKQFFKRWYHNVIQQVKMV